MKYPILAEQEKRRDMISAFEGYNHNLRIGDNEFYDMKNLTSSDYPVLSPRPRRGMYADPATPSGLLAKDSLCYIDGQDFVMNEYRVDLDLPDDGEQRTLISMGAYVIIMPDKKYVNTADLSDCGNIEAAVTTTGAVSFQLCKIDGTDYENVAVQTTEPESPANMDLWIDTSSTPHSLKQYSSTSAMWVSIATTYIKISAAGIGRPFAENDGVTISGIEDAALQDLNSTMIIWARGDDYIVVTGILDVVTSQESPVTVARRMPNMDFVIESENRLWGCRYGTDINGNVVNELYACKLGDFRNWNCFMGISTDSYVVSLGTDGQFTGAITHLGYPLFFKETCLHKVYGNYPANYQIQTTACRGVQKGSSRSLAIVNEVLYYKSRSAICAYDGSLPVDISAALGDISYGGAVAGTIGNKYYVSMMDAAGMYHLFVYDTFRGMWHKEDNTEVREFCDCRGELYFIDGLGIIRTVLGSGTVDTEETEWMAETGIIGTDSPDKKYISRLDVRMYLEVTSMIDVYIQYNSIGAWEHIYTGMGETLRSFGVPIRPKRCDHLRLRFVGRGMAKIFSICKTIEQGSDV